MDETAEWRDAVHALTEIDRAATEDSIRASVGMCGGPEDAND